MNILFLSKKRKHQRDRSISSNVHWKNKTDCCIQFYVKGLILEKSSRNIWRIANLFAFHSF